MSLHSGAVCGEGSKREQCHLLCSLPVFSHFPHYNQTGPFCWWFPGGCISVHSRTLWVSPTNSPVKLGVSPAAASPCTCIFSKRLWGFFPCAGTLGCMVYLDPQLFLLVSACECPQVAALPGPPACCLACLGPPATTLPRVVSTWLPVSAPPTGLDECFFFNSLVVGLPYSSIFCQFWLFFVFKFFVLLLVVGGGTVCLPTPPSWP